MHEKEQVSQKRNKLEKSDLHAMGHVVLHLIEGGIAVKTIFAEEVEFALELFVGCDAGILELA